MHLPGGIEKENEKPLFVFQENLVTPPYQSTPTSPYPTILHNITPTFLSEFLSDHLLLKNVKVTFTKL
jgi:hypothetical protein